jgi:hypothetical protein
MNIQQFIHQVEQAGVGSYNITGATTEGKSIELSARITSSDSLRQSVKEFIRDYGMKLDCPYRFLTVVKSESNIVLSLNEIVEP